MTLQPVLLAVQGADDGGPLSLLTGSYGVRWTAHAAVGLLACPGCGPPPRVGAGRAGPAGRLGGDRSMLGHAERGAVAVLARRASTSQLRCSGPAASRPSCPPACRYGGPDARDRLRAAGLDDGAGRRLLLGRRRLDGHRPVRPGDRLRRRAPALDLRAALLLKLGLVGLVLVSAAGGQALARRGRGRAVSGPRRSRSWPSWSSRGPSPPRVLLSGPVAPRSQVQAIASTQVDDVVQTLDVSPNLPGRNFVTVDAYQTRRPAPGPIDGVQRRSPARRRAREPAPAAQGDGRWVLATDVFDSPGTWRVAVRVDGERSRPSDDVRLDRWPTLRPGSRRRVVSAAPLQPWTDGRACSRAAVVARP